MLLMVVAFAATADAQGFLNRLKDRAVNAAESAVTMQAERKVSDEVNNAVDDVLDGKKSKKSKSNDAADDEEAVAEGEVGEADPATATSSDFKRGDVILFQDDVTAETVGEFPSKWDLFQGTVEVKTLGGVKAINLTDNAQVQPLIKEQGAYLPEEFTIEYDFYY